MKRQSQDLLNDINSAFDIGNSKQGLILLREYNQSNVNDPQSFHRQAVIEEQIGDTELAGYSHYQCLKLAPNNAIGYLYAGSWLESQ